MPKWNTYTEAKLSAVTTRLRRRRVGTFVKALNLGPGDRILDLGSEDGSYLGTCYPYPHRIVLADVEENAMRSGVSTFGLDGYRVISPDGPLPFADDEFDAVWCNSVIEHVTVGRKALATLPERDFAAKADEHQRLFASEIARVGRGYFVQTPYLHFPIEAHSWLPFVQYLPQESRWWLSRSLQTVWVKQWIADYNLYDTPRFHEHFPDATIVVERVAGLSKSLIAIRQMPTGIAKTVAC